MLLLKGDTAIKFWYFWRIKRAITRFDSRKPNLSTSLYQSKVVLFTIFNFISILKKGSSTDREQEGSPCWGVRPLCIRFKVTVTANQCSVRKEGNAFTFCVHILFLLIVAGKQCRLGTRGRPMLWCKGDGASSGRVQSQSELRVPTFVSLFRFSFIFPGCKLQANCRNSMIVVNIYRFVNAKSDVEAYRKRAWFPTEFSLLFAQILAHAWISALICANICKNLCARTDLRKYLR